MPVIFLKTIFDIQIFPLLYVNSSSRLFCVALTRSA